MLDAIRALKVGDPVIEFDCQKVKPATTTSRDISSHNVRAASSPSNAREFGSLNMRSVSSRESTRDDNGRSVTSESTSNRDEEPEVHTVWQRVRVSACTPCSFEAGTDSVRVSLGLIACVQSLGRIACM